MSYADAAALYTDALFRDRATACVCEQGLIFANDGRPDIAQLGRDVTAGDPLAVDAVLRAVTVAPVAGDLGEDAVLLTAVQTVWPAVSAARVL